MTHKRAVITNLLLYCFPVLILVGLSQLVYLNSLTNQFVYDDEFILSDNPFIKSWGNLPKLFHKDYFEFSGELSYRPVVTLSYFFDYTFWGLNPFGYHLVNALLHSLNAVLCFFLFKHFIQHRTASFIGALIFSCHPVLSETVNAIGFREDILATAFLLTGFLLYVKAVRKYSFLMYLVSVACYLLGVFSKEMAIPLLLLIFIYDILHTKNINYVQKLTHYYSGYLIVAVFYLLVRFVLLHNPVESTVSYPDNSLLVNFLTMSKVVASYITKLFLPVRLCADYIVPHSTSVLDFSFIVSFLTLAATAVIACKLYLYSRILFFSCVKHHTHREYNGRKISLSSGNRVLHVLRSYCCCILRQKQICPFLQTKGHYSLLYSYCCHFFIQNIHKKQGMEESKYFMVKHRQNVAEQF